MYITLAKYPWIRDGEVAFDFGYVWYIVWITVNKDGAFPYITIMLQGKVWDINVWTCRPLKCHARVYLVNLGKYPVTLHAFNIISNEHNFNKLLATRFDHFKIFEHIYIYIYISCKNGILKNALKHQKRVAEDVLKIPSFSRCLYALLPSDIIWREKPWSSVVLVMTWYFFGAMSLPEQMIVHWTLDQMSMKL